MKWSVEKMSPIIDVLIGVTVALTLLMVFGKDWFFSGDSIMPLYVAVITMIAYRLGMWSGRKLERMDNTKENDDDRSN